MSTTSAADSSHDTSCAFPPESPGLVALLNSRRDFELAESEHWYRIPVQSAPDGLRDVRWIAFYLTKVFGPEKWSVRHWANVRGITHATRADLLPGEKSHPRAGGL